VDISGKTFVVTGAGNGIGQEVALELVRRGAKVAAVDLSQAGLSVTADKAGANASLSQHAVDITDRAAVQALPDAVIAAHGQVDGVINCAGIIQKFVPVMELEYADIERVINVNLWGTININKAFLPALTARPQASLVNVSSMGGLTPFPGQTAYSATKGAVRLWTEGLQAELMDTNVTVSVVYPGAVSTNIAENSGAEDGLDAEESGIKMTTPGDAAAAIVSAIETGKARVRIGRDAVALDVLSRLMPTRAIQLIAKKMKEAAGIDASVS
jgi:short-subunit dehydrogenase